MIIARLVAGYGDGAVAIQKVGSQIESISWMTADGFSAAVNSFIAQNHGAGNRQRIRKGYQSAMGIVLVWGVFCTLLLIFCPAPIFRIFITEPELLPMGVDYLVILGFSQLFMSVELTTAGAFSGFGRTLPPSITSIVFTALRIPMALVLTKTALGAQRDLVEHHHFQHLQGSASVYLVSLFPAPGDPDRAGRIATKKHCGTNCPQCFYILSTLQQSSRWLPGFLLSAPGRSR